MRWAVFALAALLGGCANPPVYTGARLELPPEPVLPVLASEEETACLSDETFETLVRREARLKGHIAVLRRIIQTHNETVEGEP